MADQILRFVGRDEVSKKVEKISRKFRGLNTRLAVSQRQFAKLNRISSKFTNNIGKLGGKLKTVGASLTKFATLPVALGAGFAVKKFIDFETGLKGVQKTTGLSTDKIKELGEGLQGISKELPISTDNLLALAQVAGQTGIQSVPQLQKFAKTMAEIQIATDIVGEEGALAIAQLMGVIGESPDNVDRFGSTLVNLGNNMKSTERQILSVATKVGQASVAFKFSTPEVLALSAAMADLQIPAEKGGSQVVKALFGMRKAIDGGGNSLILLSKITGISVDNLKDRLKNDAAGTLNLFIEGLGKLEKAGENSAIALEKLGLDGVRAKEVFITLAERMDVLKKSTDFSNEGYEENIHLAREVAIFSSSLGSELTLLKNEAFALAVNLGDKLSPAVRFVSETFRSMFKFLSANPALGTVLAVVAGLVAVLGPLAIGIGFIMTLMPGLIAFVALFNAANLPLTLSVIGITLGLILLAGAIAWVVDNFTAITDFFSKDPFGIALGAILMFSHPILAILFLTNLLIKNFEKIAGFGREVASLFGIDTGQEAEAAEDEAAFQKRLGGVTQSERNLASGNIGNDTTQTNNARVLLEMVGLPANTNVSTPEGAGIVDFSFGASGI